MYPRKNFNILGILPQIGMREPASGFRIGHTGIPEQARIKETSLINILANQHLKRHASINNINRLLLKFKLYFQTFYDS